MRNPTPLCAVVAFMAVLGCTHEHQLAPPAVGAAPLERSTSKRVAVILAPPALRDTYETSTDGHTWVFKNVHGFYREAFRSALASRVAAVETFAQAPPGGFDAYVYAELSLNASGSLGKSCTASFSAALVDGNGRPITRKESTSEEGFTVVADAERACTTAMIASFNASAYAVLTALDTW
jgi:hypothetical protein